MIKETIRIQNKLGIHTRAAAKLVDVAKRYGSSIELIYRDRHVDCKSIMAVITLGAQHGNQLELVIEGEDEGAARNAIVELINNKFGED